MSSFVPFRLENGMRWRRARLILCLFYHNYEKETSMTRGIYFLSADTDNDLFQILKGIDIKKYCWYNIFSQDEVYDIDFKEDFFQEDCYDGKSFYQHIQKDHYLLFVKLQAYLEGGKFFDIHTYEEFQKSDCQLLLLIADTRYVTIYAKDKGVIEKLYEQAVINQCTNLKYITDENDTRTGMDVL